MKLWWRPTPSQKRVRSLGRNPTRKLSQLQDVSDIKRAARLRISYRGQTKIWSPFDVRDYKQTFVIIFALSDSFYAPNIRVKILKRRLISEYLERQPIDVGYVIDLGLMSSLTHIQLFRIASGAATTRGTKIAVFSLALPKIRKVFFAFYNDTNSDFEYNYSRKTKVEDASKVKQAVREAMDGFTNVKVKHLRANEYELWTDGPDESTSGEMRNLAQMGESHNYTIKMAPGYDFYA
jgi:DNA-directed RNA polymerase